MQERISKDSLSYSYEVLKEILGSIDSGIMVYDRQTKEVLFENDIVKNCNDIKRVIQTCVTFYFTGENTKSIQEHCDAQSVVNVAFVSPSVPCAPSVPVPEVSLPPAIWKA